MRGVVGWAVLALVLGSFGPAAAEDAYPARPIHWIVPFPPGGPTDTLSRVLTARLGDVWKLGIAIDNKGGASGAIGVDFAAKSPPDGYAIQLGTQSTNGSNKIFYPNLPYDPIADFEPLTLLGTACMALVIPTTIPAGTPKELVEWIRKHDGVSYAAATGSSQHIAAELLVKRAGLKATLVPYRGSAQAQPDLPTMVEAGFADLVVDGWYGMFAPARTPRSIVDKLSTDINQTLKAPESLEKWKTLGFDPIGSTPVEFAKRQEDDLAYWKQMIDYTGVKLE